MGTRKIEVTVGIIVDEDKWKEQDKAKRGLSITGPILANAEEVAWQAFQGEWGEAVVAAGSYEYVGEPPTRTYWMGGKQDLKFKESKG